VHAVKAVHDFASGIFAEVIVALHSDLVLFVVVSDTLDY